MDPARNLTRANAKRIHANILADHLTQMVFVTRSEKEAANCCSHSILTEYAL